MLTRDCHWSLSENFIRVLGVYRSLNRGGIGISICLWLEHYRIDELSRRILRFFLIVSFSLYFCGSLPFSLCLFHLFHNTVFIVFLLHPHTHTHTHTHIHVYIYIYIYIYLRIDPIFPILAAKLENFEMLVKFEVLTAKPMNITAFR